MVVRATCEFPFLDAGGVVRSREYARFSLAQPSGRSPSDGSVALEVLIRAGPEIHRSVCCAKWGLSNRWQQARGWARHGPTSPGEGVLAAVTGRVKQIGLAGHRFGCHKATSPATGLDTTLRQPDGPSPG